MKCGKRAVTAGIRYSYDEVCHCYEESKMNSVDSNGVATVEQQVIAGSWPSGDSELPFATKITAGGSPAGTYTVNPTDTEVEITLRIPEQFFTRKYDRADWERAVAEGWVDELLDYWEGEIEEPKLEVYGPDGQQVALW